MKPARMFASPRRWWAWLALAALLGACAIPPTAQPAATSGAVRSATAQRFMVAAANPLASEAGYRMLAAGGSAIDAAVAVQMVLALVEPQASGIGGGAFLMHWDGQSLQAWDGRETAPAAADERLLLRPDGRPMDFMAAAVGGRAVGVPGAVRMLEAAHRQHGKLPWASLLQPAIEMSEQGFAVSPRLHGQLKAETALRSDAQSRAYFYATDGEPKPVGHRLRNPALAAVLRAIATRGSAALHEGGVALDIVSRVRGHAVNPGRLDAADLAAYAPRLREPLCTAWRAVYRVCGFPPPSSGHLAMMQMLGMLEANAVPPPADRALPDVNWLHQYSESARLAYADRAMFVADPDFVAPPAGRWDSLLDVAYLRERAALIGPRRLPAAEPGRPGGRAGAWAPMAAQAEFGTSHISIVDGQGHALALTTTIESVFGARLMSDGGTGLPGGFLLNNQLSDFSALPADAQGRPIANRVQGGKRPRSSMSPTLVFDARDGRLLMSLGTPGGAAIIHYSAKTLVGSLDWGLTPQAAIELPNVVNVDGTLRLERGRFAASTVDALRARGHSVAEVELTSGLQAIQRTAQGWRGGADPRREGIVLGQ